MKLKEFAFCLLWNLKGLSNPYDIKNKLRLALGYSLKYLKALIKQV